MSYASSRYTCSTPAPNFCIKHCNFFKFYYYYYILILFIYFYINLLLFKIIKFLNLFNFN